MNTLLARSSFRHYSDELLASRNESRRRAPGRPQEVRETSWIFLLKGLGRGPVLGRGFAPGENTPGPTGVASQAGAGTRGCGRPVN